MNIIEMELNKLKEMMETGNIEEFLKDKPYQKELVEDIIKNLRNNASGSY